MGNTWTNEKIPSLSGKTAIVTGGNSGIGYHTALELGRAGACVVVACRNKERGEEAVAAMRKEVPSGDYELHLLDVSSLADVRRFAGEFVSDEKSGDKNGNSSSIAKVPRRVDILVNNAGVMMPPYERTKDGFELTLATNHLGPFALTGLLLPSLKASPAPRVVAVGSLAAWRGHRYDAPPADDKKNNNNKNATTPPTTATAADAGAAAENNNDNDKKTNNNNNNNNNNSEHAKTDSIDFVKTSETYSPQTTYAESKLANLLFMRELGRRHPGITSVAAHPGVTSSNLTKHHYGSFKPFMQSSAAGALPLLRAATEPGLVTGSYLAPRVAGYCGAPVSGSLPNLTRDDRYAQLYWQRSEDVTGVKY